MKTKSELSDLSPRRAAWVLWLNSPEGIECMHNAAHGIELAERLCRAFDAGNAATWKYMLASLLNARN